MALIVQKFGGTSVANPEKIKAVAQRVLGSHKQGNKMVVVLSAMSGETNRLIELALSVQQIPDLREMDMLVSTGEQVTVSLFAMAVKEAGYDAISLLGDQVSIRTSSLHSTERPGSNWKIRSSVESFSATRSEPVGRIRAIPKWPRSAVSSTRANWNWRYAIPNEKPRNGRVERRFSIVAERRPLRCPHFRRERPLATAAPRSRRRCS